MHKYLFVARIQQALASMPSPISSASRHWLQVIGLLVLALMFSVWRAPQAQAAPPSQAVPLIKASVALDTDNIICVDEKVEIIVSAHYSPSDAWPRAAVIRVFEESPLGIGEFTVREIWTAENRRPGSRLNIGVFQWTAKKPGTVRITFQGRIIDGPFLPVSKPVTIKVGYCVWFANVTTEWNVPGPAGIRINAEIANAEMRADDQGRLTGTGVVNWNAKANPVEDCSGTIEIGSSGVQLTGDIGDGEQVTMEMNYDPAAVVFNADCGAAGGSRQETATPDALAFSLPSSGGTTLQNQGLSGPGVTASTTITLTPKEDQGAAFIPNSETRVAESSSIWPQSLWAYLAWFAGL